MNWWYVVMYILGVISGIVCTCGFYHDEYTKMLKKTEELTEQVDALFKETDTDFYI